MDLQSFLNHFQENPQLLFFFAALIGGEELIVPLAFLVGTGLWDIPSLFIFSAIGTIVADVAWFLLGRHGIQKTAFFKRHSGKHEQVKKLIRKVAKHEFNLLLLTKFIYGARIFTIIHLSLEETHLYRFIALNSIVIVVWLTVIINIGWWAGRGSTWLTSLVEHPLALVLGVLATLVLFHLGRNLVGKKLTKTTLQQ